MKDKATVVRDIRARAFRYSLRAIKLYRCLQETRDGAGWLLGKQYLRAATSIGANLEEGLHGESRADFIHNMRSPKRRREKAYTGFVCWQNRTPFRKAASTC
jgi:hypothetical protein